MKKIIIAIVLAGLLLLMMPTAVSADSGVTVVDRTGDGEWIDDTWRVEMFPGEVKSTTLTLYNSSSSSLDVEVNVSPASLDNGNLTFELDKSNFTMSGRSYTDVTLTLRASGSATPGTYTTELLEIKSEVPPPRPSRPSPSAPTPEIPEPEEPVVEEPEPVEPVEPTEPEEPTKPEEPAEPEEPIEPVKPIEPEEPCRWSLLDSILASLILILLGLDIWEWRRRRV